MSKEAVIARAAATEIIYNDCPWCWHEDETGGCAFGIMEKLEAGKIPKEVDKDERWKSVGVHSFGCSEFTEDNPGQPYIEAKLREMQTRERCKATQELPF